MKIAISVSGKEKAKGSESPYFKAMLSAGAQPEEVQMVTADDLGKVSAGAFDGILFTGGEDVDPSFYDEQIKHQNVHVNRSRDQFEFGLLEAGLKRGIPILGICRGIQMINVKFGGTLYQDLKSETSLECDHKQAGSRSATTHSVTVTEPDSLLHDLIPGNCMVNSLHHQAIKRLGRGLKVTAHSEDELYEAIELADHYPFFLAVQWHPEELVGEHPEQVRIFAEFIARCRDREAQKGAQSRL
ncbi:MAG: gamma-glutamyl-gamma-aminobutyrate hydrolase family protein [Acidobacteria bacterium]|nr:gamma-glutamyl-gamma-aminobutyrate hydrolase family protein [Acidobacteriota bacterium]